MIVQEGQVPVDKIATKLKVILKVRAKLTYMLVKPIVIENSSKFRRELGITTNINFTHLQSKVKIINPFLLTLDKAHLLWLCAG